MITKTKATFLKDGCFRCLSLGLLENYCLLIDTATAFCSVAISEKDKIVYEKTSDTRMSHASQLTRMIKIALEAINIQPVNLKAIAVSNGPGSYTGLRIGASTAKGMAYALDLPVIAIDSLKSLALASISEREKAIYVPMVDARRMEVYTAIYSATGTVLELPHAKIIDVNSFKDWIDQGYEIVLSGDGSEKCRTILTHSCFIYTDILNEAKYMAQSVWKNVIQKQWSDLAYFEPSYLKPPNITVSKKKL